MSKRRKRQENEEPEYRLGMDGVEVDPREVAITRGLLAAVGRLQGFPLQDLLRVVAALLEFAADRWEGRRVSAEPDEIDGEPVPAGARACLAILDAMEAGDFPRHDYLLGAARYLDGMAMAQDRRGGKERNLSPEVLRASRACAIAAEQGGKEPLIAQGASVESIAAQAAGLISELLGAPVEVMGEEEIAELKARAQARAEANARTVN